MLLHHLQGDIILGAGNHGEKKSEPLKARSFTDRGKKLKALIEYKKPSSTCQIIDRSSIIFVSAKGNSRKITGGAFIFSSTYELGDDFLA